MKAFSNKWISSVKPKKQRKYRYNAPLHTKGKFLSVNLAKDLRDKYGKRSVRVRVGDEVKVLRGQYKTIVGKVNKIDLKDTKVFIAGVEYSKRDGSKSMYPTNPSNLQIVKLDLADKLRKKKLEGTKKPSVDDKAKVKN